MDIITCEQLVYHLNALSLLYKFAHHHVARASFFSDHEILNKFYEETAQDFDIIAERHILLNNSYDIIKLNQYTLSKSTQFKQLFNENRKYFEYLLTLEKELVNMVNLLCKNPQYSEGTKNTFGEIASRSEQRQYLIKQRLKG